MSTDSHPTHRRSLKNKCFVTGAGPGTSGGAPSVSVTSVSESVKSLAKRFGTGSGSRTTRTSETGVAVNRRRCCQIHIKSRRRHVWCRVGH